MGGLALYDQNGDFRVYLKDSHSFQHDDYAVAEEIEHVLRGRSHPVFVIVETHEPPDINKLTRRAATAHGREEVNKNRLLPPATGQLPDMLLPESQSHTGTKGNHSMYTDPGLKRVKK
ncbi:hypothetical protein V5O48_014419 [Marasmius crinis-equi]|uniref:Uncharacterized protein n=1 Tax=Marasmius crinis-equi TaxID=585013 RepID=A0ABR3EXQ8_9AGAR